MDAQYCRRVAEHIDKATFFGLAAYWARMAKKAEHEAKEEKLS